MAKSNPQNKSKKRKPPQKKRVINIPSSSKKLMNLDPELINDAISKAVSYKRTGEYDKSISIYESLYKEYEEDLTAGILVGWAKTLAVAGYFEEAVEKYTMTIKKAKKDGEKERELVYSTQQKRLLDRNKNKKEFELWLKEASGNPNYIVQEEKVYIKELSEINIFESEVELTTDDLKKYEEYKVFLNDTIEKIKESCNKIVNFKNGLFTKDELDLKNWIFYYKKDIYFPVSFSIGKPRFIEADYFQDFNVFLENSNGKKELIEYVIKPTEFKIWDTFVFDFRLIGIDKKGEFIFNDYISNEVRYGNGPTNRIFLYKGKANYEFVMPCGKNGQNSLFPYGKKPKINMYNFVHFLGYAIKNYDNNNDFYFKWISLLLLHEDSLIFNNILSLILIRELKVRNIISSEEENDLIEVWKNEKKYLQKVSQECCLIPELRGKIKESFVYYNIESDILENIFSLAYEDYYVTCIYNKINPLSIEKFRNNEKKGIVNNYLNIFDSDGLTPLMKSSKTGDFKKLKELIEAGADLNVQNKFGYTALMLASEKGHLEVVKHLVKSGAMLEIELVMYDDLENQLNDNVIILGTYTALLLACQEGNTEIVEELIKAGANLNVVGVNGFTPILWASHEGYSDIVKKLIQANVDLDVQDNLGDSVLIIESRRENIEIVRDLILRGADLNVQDENGQTALMFSSAEGCLEIVKELIKAGAELNLQDYVFESTALIHASKNGRLEVVKELINAGADVDIQDEDGQTALVLTFLSIKSLFMFRPLKSDLFSLDSLKMFLIDSIDYCNNSTNKWLYDLRENLQIALELINAGANITIKDFQNNSAIDIAKGELILY